MTSLDDQDGYRKPQNGIQGAARGGLSIPEEQRIKYPPVEDVLAVAGYGVPRSSLFPPGTETFNVEDQRSMLESVRNFVEKTDIEDIQELQRSFSQGGRSRGHAVQSFDDMRVVLNHLWACKSDCLIDAAELLANESRDARWRAPFGRSGVLNFFLRIIAARGPINQNLLLHSLRLVGNSCADTDENREVVVNANYTLSVIRHLLTPGLIQVAIPVIYNICIDFAPAQAQVAKNQLAYVLLKLIKDGAIKDNDALLDFSYELIEMTAQVSTAEPGVNQTPNGAISLLMDLAVSEEVSFSQFSSLVTCLAAYLERSRFQDICISNRMVDRVLSVLERSFSIEEGRSIENIQSLVQLQLKLNQSLAELSGSPLFIETYPLDSPLTQTLKSWLTASEDQLQVCACVMLGNLARSDEVCEQMIRELNIHTELISILKSDAKAAVLHAVLGFLKNLAIAYDNRLRLGDAGIISAVSPLWAYETVPQVQFSAVSVARQVIISSVENISRLLESVSSDFEEQTYLSLLLALFEKTDSAPIKTEIGRIVASICRTVCPKAREQDSKANAILGRLFGPHKGIAHPVGAMITQTQWPVVQSEGWFALALMASNTLGCQSVVNCLQDSDVFRVLEDTLSAEVVDAAEEGDELRMTKTRDNMVVFSQELLKNESDTLSPSWRDRMEDLMKNHVSRHLKNTKGC